MSHRMIRLLSFCMPAVLVLAACQPKPRTFLPVTGSKESSLPALVVLTRESVLGYVLSSERLATIPPVPDWQLDASKPSETEYRFRSGDWLMLIRLADAGQEHQRVLIINHVEKLSWTGYVTADGHVVDTAYGH